MTEHNPHARAAARGTGTAARGNYPPARQYTETEKANLLKGCVEMQQALWGDLDDGATVRYITRNRKGDDDAGFRRGGIVMGYMTTNPEDDGRARRLMKLGAHAGSDKHWWVDLEDIERLWSKVPKWVRRQEERMQAALAQVEENRKVLQRRVKALEKRLDALERRR